MVWSRERIRIWRQNYQKLEQIGFIKSTDQVQQFGIMDPSLVIRRAHIIPAFPLGCTFSDSCVSPSAPFQSNSPKEDHEYELYYVNRSARKFYTGSSKLIFFLDLQITTLSCTIEVAALAALFEGAQP